MRVVVAGASGAIGRVLVAELRTGGHEVIGLTRGVAGASSSVTWAPNRSSRTYSNGTHWCVRSTGWQPTR